MTDEQLLQTVIFQTIARLRVGSTVTDEILFDGTRKSSHEYSQARGMTEDDKYALALNAHAAIKADWSNYITVAG